MRGLRGVVPASDSARCAGADAARAEIPGIGRRRRIRPDRVYVLSRVTLGADVAVTSVLLDAAKKRYPDAEILFVGPKKNFELFEADPRIAHFAVAVSAVELAARPAGGFGGAVDLGDGIVIDPDSRLTQLGLIRVCDDAEYFFFQSRSYGGDGLDRLPDLAARWASEVFGVEDARPYHRTSAGDRVRPRRLP